MDEYKENLEPREVVSWYVPPQGQEVVDYYVQKEPLPRSVRPAQPQQPRRKKRLGLWIFLGVLAVLAVVLALFALLDEPQYDDALYDDTNDDASSIVDIYADHETTIPRYTDYDPTLTLPLRADHGDELTAQQVYAAVNPATVLVVTQQGEKASVGTGVIMTSDGYVITNAHVISGGESCWVATYDNRSYDAKLVGYDAPEDIAVLKLENAQNLPVAEFGDSELALVGDPVYAIGNPLGLELRGTLTDGIISAINRSVSLDGRSLTTLQTTAALNNGNSGGPLINRYGQVIGINTLKMSGRGIIGEATVEGLGFALPVSEVSLVINDIIANGKYFGAPSLGIMVYSVMLEDGSGAVEVKSVEAGSAAEDAGIQAGDVILGADGQDVYSTDDLLAIRRTHAIGDTMTLHIYRGGEYMDIDVVLRSDRSY